MLRHQIQRSCEHLPGHHIDRINEFRFCVIRANEVRSPNEIVLHIGLKAARKAAGMARGTLHSLRHTFISRAANNGAAIHLVSKWAGHSDLATTQKYLHTNQSYEYLEMDKMLENEKAIEKIVALDEYRKAS